MSDDASGIVREIVAEFDERRTIARDEPSNDLERLAFRVALAERAFVDATARADLAAATAKRAADSLVESGDRLHTAQRALLAHVKRAALE